MSELTGQQRQIRILLGVTGSIAAFKAAALASLLVQDGSDVRAIVTEGGARFVGRLTFEAVTGHVSPSTVWEEHPGGTRMGHLDLARWADALVVAPASASALGRLALGLPTDLLGAVALACEAPLVLAPAMETAMWRHPATRQNVATLRERGAVFVGPETGHLASGTSGEGRMAEPETIRAAIVDLLGHRRSLDGTRVLITAGPTFEPLDPVRYIGNRSSGKMGFAIAEEAAARGATVTLVSGPTALASPNGVDSVLVETAAEMRDAVLTRAARQDVIVMAAAVADFTPAEVSRSKLKREGARTVRLQPTDDIAAAARVANPGAVHVGFALETDDLVAMARSKLERKGQELVVANAITGSHNPFGSESNTAVLVGRESVRELPSMSKRELAGVIWDEIERLRQKQ